MSSAHAGRWRLRPHDPKCKTFIDPDPVVEGQIRCKVPLWSGDFDELKPELTAQGVRLDDLPKLTVYDVGQYVIRAAQGGSLQCGPVGTAADTIVPGAAAHGSGRDEWAEANFGARHWRLLEVCCEQRFLDKGSAKPLRTIAAYAAGQNGKRVSAPPDDYRRTADFLKSHGYLTSVKGIGAWATAKGVRAVDGRRTSRSMQLRVTT